jgi:acetolactate synthase-1/2/3 large subunit
MGMGVPAAVAASIQHPERTVLCFAGDGDFLMTAQELATAVQYGAAPLVIVFDNGMYGTIRMHQEREFPERTIGTQLVNPDFAAYAQAFGGHGEWVERTEAFEGALERSLRFIAQNRRPALIALRTDPRLITPNLSLEAIRQSAQSRRA